MARHMIVCRSTFSAPSADAYTIISTNIAITRWRGHALHAARPYAIEAIRQPITATSGAAIRRPFRSSHSFAAHEVRPDVENRESDRSEHSCGCECREPTQDSNAEGLLHLNR